MPAVVKSRPTTRQPRVTSAVADDWLDRLGRGDTCKTIARLSGYCESAVERHTRLARERRSGNVVPIGTAFKGPRPLQQKIAETARLLAKYQEDLRVATLIENTRKDDTVSFRFGRGRTNRVRTGTVLAIGDTPAGRKVVVLTGDKMDWEVCNIAPRDIKANHSAA